MSWATAPPCSGARVRKPDHLPIGARFPFEIAIDRPSTGPAAIFRYDSVRLTRRSIVMLSAAGLANY